MKNLAVIPARGGSKRIPNKNIRLFNEKPIIQYSIEAAYNSGLFEEVMVSTDDQKIAQIAIELGAKVPFYRSAAAAGDHATLAEVIIDVMDSYQAKGLSFDYFCCILATAPFVTVEKLKEGYKKLIDEKFDSVVPFVHYPVPIQQALKINPENNKVEMFFDDQYGIRTQDFVPSYYDAGMFYWMKPESVKSKRRISCDNTGAVILSELETHDIDTENDWKIAEQKYYYIHNVVNKK
ncbi:MAG: pseudaminic acid cytidylyltransferase [Bacteroidetes bacterium RIFOXYA12_FULL_35_11]|nr:MAG: pseudaminic acid cytidylyltransferase [Bacteroidetes bacterium GWF2_35_48]OFY73079.1 MAG: pseudaminic acid cytidylyltransferase [Bacteroidetes bacterium RIFOXYA12_FULL_35_11]OFY93949.1 MAG: pseudaminic acid cytidylyltransferase [Bacteroidetes bacterium RIFOXYC12_FULL_35_7]OFY97849.1 MAG: pseudaminic acid cytidylyltransferase [Bacteroidetes bacterium RIFOXYB2_FULL_35_7]HBX53544.1 pseudaminic acid cytidylyltransferase [Bacteroidales bacterium]